MDTQPAPIGAASNVVTLLVSRQVGDSRACAPVEQVGDRAHHVHVLPFPKTAHARHSKPQRVAGLAKAAHVQDSTGKTGARAEQVSETGRNERLRRERARAWRAVEAKLDYWRAWRALHSSIRDVHELGVIDRVYCPTWLQAMNDFDEPWRFDNSILGFIMIAERELLLTPAPTVALLDKKRKLASGCWYRLADGSIEGEIERAIADDETWLEAHPARQCRSNRARRSAD